MGIFQNITEYIVPILSSGFLTLVITKIIGYFSNKSSRKIKLSIIKTKLYSPVVRFMTSTDFLNCELAEAMENIEQTLYKKYDYIHPNIISHVSKLKAKIAKNEIKEISMKEFFNLYFSIQVEYNMAKKAVSLDYDSRYTNTDEKIYARFGFIILAIYALIDTIIFISVLMSGSTDFDFMSSITNTLGVLMVGVIVLAGIFLFINLLTTRRSVLKEWKGLIVKKSVTLNSKDGESNDASTKPNHD